MTESNTVITSPETKPVDNSPYGKRDEKQTGNNLFQDCIAGPYAKALAFMKANPRVLTPSQRKRKAKNRAARKAAKRSR